MLAIVSDESLKSLRDLTKDHLPLLEAINSNCQKILKDNFNFPKHKIRAYIHYLPTFFQFHVHFTHVDNSNESSTIERARFLQDVIHNINLDSNYYQKATMQIFVKDSEKLFQNFKEKIPKIFDA